MFAAPRRSRGPAETDAVKRVLAWQLEQARIARGLSKRELARQMRTSQTQIDRLLDPVNTRVQLDTLQRAAEIPGRKLAIDLV